MKKSLPLAQKLFERHRDDERVRIVAVATAFEKAHYPWMADEAKIKSTLTANGWKFPVMRDADEKSVGLFVNEGRYGTPMTVVVDASGIVRWHGFSSSSEASREVEATVEDLLESFFVPAIKTFHPRLKTVERAYRGKSYAKAYSAAMKIAEKESEPKAARKQAKEVTETIDAAVKRLLDQSAAKRQAGYPEVALERLAQAKRIFKGVPSAKAATQREKGLKRDKGFKKELKASKLLAKIETAFAKAKPAEKARLQKELLKLSKSVRGTPVEGRIQRIQKALR